MNDQDSHLEQLQARRASKTNPVIAKEMRAIVRQPRFQVVITFYLVALSIIIILLYLAIVSTNAIYPDPDVRRFLGKIIFRAILLTQLFAILFSAPLLSAESIATEKENKTFDLLLVTSLSASVIVRGKLFVSIMFTMLLLLISLPLQSGAFLLGGLTPAEFLVSAIILVMTTIILSSVSIWASTRTKRTSSAIGLAYLISVIFVIGIPVLAYILLVLAPVPGDQGLYDALKEISKKFAPGTQPVVIVSIWLLLSSNPISVAVTSYYLFLSEGVKFKFDLEPVFQLPLSLLTPWVIFLILSIFISWFFYRSAIHKIK